MGFPFWGERRVNTWSVQSASTLFRAIPSRLKWPAVGAVWAISTAVAAAGEIQGSLVLESPGTPAGVWIEGLESQEVPRQDTVITHRDGRFYPYLSLGFVGNEFVLTNEDDRLHNTHLYLRLAYQKERSARPLHFGSTVFNIALPNQGAEVRRPIRSGDRYRAETGFIEVGCNPHPDEQAYVLVFDHPYAAMVGDDGTFSIANVPAGTHQLQIWADGAVQPGPTIEVSEDGVATVVVNLASGA